MTARAKSLDTDVFTAGHAFAKFAIVDFLQRGVDLGEQPLLAFAEPTGELQVDFGRRRVDLIGKIIGVEMDVSPESLLLIPI